MLGLCVTATNRFLQSSLQLDFFFSVSCANFDSFVSLEKERERL